MSERMSHTIVGKSGRRYVRIFALKCHGVDHSKLGTFFGTGNTEDMGNRGVMHKAGSFERVQPKTPLNRNGMLILAYVGNPIMSVPSGDSSCHPFVLIWGLACAWVYHNIQIRIFLASWPPFSTRGSRTCWDHFLIIFWWSAKLSREHMALHPPKHTPFLSSLPMIRPFR